MIPGAGKPPLLFKTRKLDAEKYIIVVIVKTT
jgi:hypothetical protein